MGDLRQALGVIAQIVCHYSNHRQPRIDEEELADSPPLYEAKSCKPAGCRKTRKSPDF